MTQLYYSCRVGGHDSTKSSSWARRNASQNFWSSALELIECLRSFLRPCASEVLLVPSVGAVKAKTCPSSEVTPLMVSLERLIFKRVWRIADLLGVRLSFANSLFCASRACPLLAFMISRFVSLRTNFT